VSFDVLCDCPKESLTPLLFASTCGNLQLVKLLVGCAQNLNVTSTDNVYSIYFVAYFTFSVGWFYCIVFLILC